MDDRCVANGPVDAPSVASEDQFCVVDGLGTVPPFRAPHAPVTGPVNA